eukprot:6179816-Pleurochrysis_carterae.AAC.1
MLACFTRVLWDKLTAIACRWSANTRLTTKFSYVASRGRAQATTVLCSGDSHDACGPEVTDCVPFVSATLYVLWICKEMHARGR